MLMGCQEGYQVGQGLIFMCMWVLMAKRCHKVEGRVFWEFGENVGECGSNVGQVHPPKIPPFSPLHCATLFALNEASNFEFEFLAPYYPFQKCANPLFLTKGVIFVICLCLLTPSQFLALQATPKGCGAHVGPPYKGKAPHSQK